MIYKQVKTTIGNVCRAVIIAGMVCCANNGVFAEGGNFARVQFETLREQLSGPNRSPRTRLDAARHLLRSNNEKAFQFLRDALEDLTSPAAQVAVARAVVREGVESSTFIDPLVEMVSGANSTVRLPAAEALVIFDDDRAAERLIAVAADRKAARGCRLAAMEAMGEGVDRRFIGALIGFLKDPDTVIRSAAAASLQQLTHRDDFGTNWKKWNGWWSAHKDAPQGEWLASATRLLTRKNIFLEEENKRLRQRLVGATREIYNASPKQQRPKIIGEMLSDSLADIRLLGITLADTVILEDPNALPKLRLSIRGMLDDDDPRVRKSAALLYASCGGEETPGLLTQRLKKESNPGVRDGLFEALGRLKSPSTIPVILEGIRKGDDSEATAAASALIHILSNGDSLSEQMRRNAITSLKQRFAAVNTEGNAPLRESLFLAMGAVKDDSFKDIMREGLEDNSAAIRRACVTGLTGMDAVDAAPAIAGLINDEDRGVRQAAISALMDLDGRTFLKSILKRADSAVEPDQAVREQACEAILAIGKQLETEAFPPILEMLGKQEGVSSLTIGILQQYIDALRRSDSSKLPDALHRLGKALLDAKRPVEAERPLKEAFELAKRSDASVPSPVDIWNSYIDASLKAGDPNLGDIVADVEEDSLVAIAVGRLKGYVGDIKKLENPEIIPMLESVLQKVAERISNEDREYLAGRLQYLIKLRIAADRQQVQKLLSRLTPPEAADDDKSADQIVGMGKRALRPLLEELRATVLGEKSRPDREKMIVKLLRQIMSDLGEYPFGGSVDEKIKTIDAWLAGLSG